MQYILKNPQSMIFTTASPLNNDFKAASYRWPALCGSRPVFICGNTAVRRRGCFAKKSRLTDKICENVVFFLRKAKGFPAKPDAFYEEGHISREGAHGLEALGVLKGFLRCVSMDHIPILAGGHGHP